MQRIDGQWIYSATDLNHFLECRRLTELNTLVQMDRHARPADDDEQAQLIRDKGRAHEEAYLARLHAEHDGDVVRIAPPANTLEAYRQAEASTIEAMRSGARVIYQATFFDGRFIGHADFLQRVETPAPALGLPWSYEAADTKLALSTKPYFLIQLCNYSEHLQRVQGVMPRYGSIVFGDGERLAYKLHDYLAYYRRVKQRFLHFADSFATEGRAQPSTYPLRCEHCAVCPWNEECTNKRRDDDHLSLIAWMRRDQHGKFERHGITTVSELAAAPQACPLPGMSSQTYAKLRKQAQLQVHSRTSGLPVVELLPHDPRTGFGLLPQPAAGDVYFDMEGDPLYEPRRGLEYLFGCWLPDDRERFIAFWGCDRTQEKQAFEAFIDFIVERRKQHPGLHVYHYANYEKAALTRLSQQHSTRAEELDELLRSEIFVDLYAVVRQSMMIGEESYSIKKLERFYGLRRTTGVKKGDASIVMFERWRLTGDQAILDDIRDYNKDDCESTRMLHEWLLERRSEAIARFGEIPFRPLKTPRELCHDEPFDHCSSCRKREKARREERRRTDLERQLLAQAITPQSDEAYHAMGEAMRTRYLLGHLLSYHRRETNPQWWDFFRRCENADELLDADREALGGLQLVEDADPYKASPRDKHLVYTYTFPEQRHKMDPGDACDPATRESAGTILSIDDDNRVLRLKRGGGLQEARALQALIPRKPLENDAQVAALSRIAQAYVEGTLARDYPATYDLLAARDPRCGRARVQPEEIAAAAVLDLTRSLESSYLFIQGPPGTGKSTIGAEVICDVLKDGMRVGVMSNSHKAAHNLLHNVERAMHRRGERFRGLYKHATGSAHSAYVSVSDSPFIESTAKNEEFDGGDFDIAGGTAWLFSRAELAGMFDYLFIDEAGQVSLADALAVSLCAKNIVLLGDPSQLAQVSVGIHAPHCGDSVLQHLLGTNSTVPPERGLFLNRSYRMHPEVCAFISDSLYEGRLLAAESTRRHRVDSPGLNGAGLRHIGIAHEGNTADSIEEAERILAEIATLRQGTVTDDDGVARPLRDRDIIVVTPYNAQRRLLQSRLQAAGFDVPVGTVDKFQGQQAAVVFYSMATSSGEDVPRDVGFLFEANRFNVAVSRARAMSVLVCSPRLLDVQCRSAEQLAMVNLLCAYVEAATGTHACLT